MNKIFFLKKFCDDNSLTLSDESIELLEKYNKEILNWNKKINLISRQDEENILAKHVLGSISFLFQSRFKENSYICDFGTGGGLPGIPIAILNPDIRVLLIDSIQKKIFAVNQIVQSLGLQNVRVFCGRGEELGKTEDFKNKFDYVIARAVSSVKNLVKWCKPLLKKIPETNTSYNKTSQDKFVIPRGSLVLLKGGDLKNEIREAEKDIGFKGIQVHDINVKGDTSIELSNKKLVIIQP